MIGLDTTFLVHLELVDMTEHARAHSLLRKEALDVGVPLALVPQVLAEFLHIVTDPKRFQKPLTMAEALERSEFWWNAVEVRLFMEWMRTHALGRKRILDTQLAATLHSAGVRRIFTSNAKDFAFPNFTALTP